MKFELIEENKYIIYLSNEYLNFIDLNLDANIEQSFKKLFNNINKKYSLDLEGFYDVLVYVNKHYGIIIEMEKEIDDYIRMFNKKLDMKLTFKFDENFLVESEIGDYFYNDKLYKVLSGNITDFENEIIYGDLVKNIVKADV